MKKYIIIPLLVGCLFLSTCFSPWQSEGTFTVSIGGGGSARVILDNGIDTNKDLYHVIGVGGGPGEPQTKGLKGEGEVPFWVTPGKWDIYVSAYMVEPGKEGPDDWAWYENYKLSQKQPVARTAGGLEVPAVTIKSGPNGPVTNIQMEWITYTEYTVTFDLDGGTAEPELKPQTVREGEGIKLPMENDLIENEFLKFTKEGYAFGGWRFEDGTPVGTNYYDPITYTAVYVPGGDITLYAIWTEE